MTLEHDARAREDFRAYLYGLTPDPQAEAEAHAFAADLYAGPQQDPATLLMTLAAFHGDYAGPGLPPALSEAVGALAYAASGLFAFVQAEYGPEDTLEERRLKEWKAWGRAREWAAHKRAEAAAPMTAEEVRAYEKAYVSLWEEVDPHSAQVLPQPQLMHEWAKAARETGKEREAARFAVWAAVYALLDAAPTLPDGHSEGIISGLLEALAPKP